MNGSSILKKTLPIICTVILIVVIAVTASAIKKNSAKAPALESQDEVYLEVKEGNFTYTVTKGEVYEELKGQIGLSTLITMINKDVLAKEKDANGKSYWDLAKEKVDEDGNLEILNLMDKDCYGEDVDVTTLTAEEKAEKEHDYYITMYTGYGYTVDETNLHGSQDLLDHYTLVLAKELYAKDALAKEIAEDEDYFDDDDIEDYYDDHYNKSYYAIIVPFKDSGLATIALQQVGIKNSSYWYGCTVEETETGSGIYECKINETGASVKEVVEAFIAIYNSVYAYKGEDALIKSTDYKVVSIDNTILTAAQAKLGTLKEQADAGATNEDFNAAFDEAKAALEALQAELTTKEVDTKGIENALTKITAAKTAYDDNPADLTILSNINSAVELLDSYNAETIVFDTDNEESPLYWDYEELSQYDSTLPSKLNNSLSTYIPFGTNTDDMSVNDGDATWYTKTVITNSNVSYLILKLGEVAAKELADVKDEIIETLTTAAVDEITSENIETKMCELREKYDVVIYDKDLQKQWIANCDKYDVDHKENKKKSDLIAKYNDKEIKVEDLFNEMDKTLGLAVAISSITQQRLINNTNFDKYYDAATGKWTKEGKDIKDNIAANIEAQRLNFLAGSYSYYGYTPSKDYTWEDFMYEINGVKTEKDLAMLSLYSQVSQDYIAKAIEFVSVNEETELDKIDFLMNETDALASQGWAILNNRMSNDEKFSVTGEHFLVSKYADPSNAFNAGTPVDPTDADAEGAWTDEQKALAKELLEEVYKYLQYNEGSYTDKLKAIAEAFDSAPYYVNGADPKDPVVVDSSNEKWKYTLEYPGGVLDVAKYKSNGLYVKFEDLGTFAEDTMVKNFNDAAKSIWEADKADDVSDRVTIYANADGAHYIETEFGYHLYINLGSTFSEDVTLPSLSDIRASYMINALTALLSGDEAKDEAINAKIDEIKAGLAEDALTNVTTYAQPILDDIAGNYFSALLQQEDIAKMAEGTWTNGTAQITLNSNAYAKEDIVKMIRINAESTCEQNVKNLEKEDVSAFDLTKEFAK